MVLTDLHILLLREKGETDHAQSVGTCIILSGTGLFIALIFPKTFLMVVAAALCLLQDIIYFVVDTSEVYIECYEKEARGRRIALWSEYAEKRDITGSNFLIR